MKVTAISTQIKNPDRVSVSVDGNYRFSLDVYQMIDLGIRIGNDYTEAELLELETESQFGKLYARALEYCLMRPHSRKEVKDYLWRKTRVTKYKTRGGEVKERAGVSVSVAERVLGRLDEKGYVNDEKFARYWVENRNQTKGTSIRKLAAELQAKGIDRTLIDAALQNSERDDQSELLKVIEKKRRRYDDEAKLMQYLARQGFRYDDIKRALESKE